MKRVANNDYLSKNFQSDLFFKTLDSKKIDLKRNKITTLQINIGKKCNQACSHCHVEAGSNRTENMNLASVNKILELMRANEEIQTVDITGGAPELNPHFRYFVKQIRKQNKNVIDRCNLTVLEEPGQEDAAKFLANQGVQIIASLPCYLEENVNNQRGMGVFKKSIRALKKLNDLGYGDTKSGLNLSLVYNPVGYHLPPSQNKLERDYKKYLKDNYGVVFNQLFTITNMPIKRFANSLIRDGKLAEYMQLLIDNFNPQSCENLMCKSLISIGYDGQIYDCDFNQMLEIQTLDKKNIHHIKSFDEITNKIALFNHCFGCTAGAGSSCSGALT